MPKLVTQLFNRFTNNRRQLLLATVVVLLVTVVSLVYDLNFKLASAPGTSLETTAVVGPVLEASLPSRLVIPAVNISAAFEAPLGLTPGQEIEVPVGYDTVAYYQFGPTPGELGPAVILGHVDSFEGPAVLFSLGQLDPGDEIFVEREDGSVAVFAVTALERHSQKGFPTEKVYQDIDHAGLRIITCSGVYDRDNLRYTHNLIVYAKLVGTTTKDVI